MTRKLTPYFDALKEQGFTEIPTLGIPLILSITTLGKLYGFDPTYLRKLKSDVIDALQKIDNDRLARITTVYSNTPTMTRYSDNLIEVQLAQINEKMNSFVEQIAAVNPGVHVQVVQEGINAEIAKIKLDAMQQPRHTMSGPRPRL